MIISIITICYNAVNVIERTINSVISQTYQDVEYIVIDGKSNDGTVDLIRNHLDRIDKFISEPDSGIYNAMNKGIKQMTGDYCLFMNAGDCFKNKNVLQEAVSYLTGEAVISGIEIDIRNGKVEDVSFPPHKLDFAFFCNNCIKHQATFIRTDIIKANLYDESMKIAADWKFWFQQLYINQHSYKWIDVDICLFSRDGISTTDNSGVANSEREQTILSELGEEAVAEFNALRKRTFIQYVCYRIQSRISREWRLLRYRGHFSYIEFHKIR